ncbi:hypothetical protein GTY83_00450 [Streptomyces sp. SID4928]|uniref:hypothetical protein n=1 Tax=Streptomyces TaxID=1883 RepID=UPI00131BC2EB|nr:MULTISPECIES: hypothetical protein [Streptomyces]MYR47600.1 hypothetical protein [Streptomyces sp. SID4928]
MERLAQVPQGHGRKESTEAVRCSQVGYSEDQFVAVIGAVCAVEGCCGTVQEVGQLGDPGVIGHLPTPAGHGAAEFDDEAAACGGQPR